MITVEVGEYKSERFAPDSRWAVGVRLWTRAYIWLTFLVLDALALRNVRIRNGWAIGDWLINYQAGFVRRGLIGEIALQINRLLHIPLVGTVVVMQLGLYGIFLYVVWELLPRREWRFWILAFILSPATLAFPVLDPLAGFRKDIIHFAGLALLLCLLLRKVDAVWLSSYLTVALVFSGLSHESLLGYSPYYFCAVAIVLRTPSRVAKVTALPFAGTLITAYAVTTHPGRQAMAAKICSSIGSTLAEKEGICGGAIAYLANDAHRARLEVIQAVHDFHYLLLYPLLLILALLPAFLGARLLWRFPRVRIELWLLLAAILLSGTGTSVLFFYGSDWGRWIYIHIMSIFLLLLFIDFRRRVEPDVEANFVPPQISRRLDLFALAALCLYTAGWNLPHMGIYPPRFGYADVVRYLVHHRSGKGT